MILKIGFINTSNTNKESMSWAYHNCDRLLVEGTISLEEALNTSCYIYGTALENEEYRYVRITKINKDVDNIAFVGCAYLLNNNGTTVDCL